MSASSRLTVHHSGEPKEPTPNSERPQADAIAVRLMEEMRAEDCFAPHGELDDAPLAAVSDIYEEYRLRRQPGAPIDSEKVLQLVEEMKAAWRQGQRPEDFLARHPQLCSDARYAVQLIYEEICLRQEFGLEVVSAEIAKRFPQWEAQLRFLLDCHGLLQPIKAGPIFPDVGETWTDFQLLCELGRGTFGRVFLARQHSLGDRPIVLKMMAGHEGEHLSLARLQHTHIMPLFAVQDDPARHLRALCMPYFGGTSFRHILDALADKPVGQRTGQDILDALDKLQAASPVALPIKGPARQLLARASYVQAVCWIGACLAEALQYAHDRGLVHLDVKPQNVLLASDGQPMLLDFNLAREPLRPGTGALDSFGGTPEYMSPEQEFALAQMRAGLPISTTVDARSDLYSLGLVLHEALGGPLSFEAAPPYLPVCNPRVSLGLADLIHKCLAHEACDRYPDTAALASDLRRHLADLPLHGVGNRSLRERWGKWRQRQPHALAQAGLLITLLTGALVAGMYAWGHVSHQVREAEMALADGQAQFQSHACIAVAEGLPANRSLLQELGGQLHLVQRAQAAHKLHILAERIRFLFGTDPLPGGQVSKLEAQCRKVWDTRELMMERAGCELEPATETQIKVDLLDLAVLWADVRVRTATGYQLEEARRDALRLLEEAESLFGPNLVLARESQAHAQALGRPALAQSAAVPPQTAWEHYSLGRFLMHSGTPAPAIAEFERAVDLQPQDFWPNFYQGVCAYRLGRYDDAVTAFRVCLALAPDSAECLYNRASAQAALGRTERALHDYSRALQIDPTLSAAALNRGVLHHQGTRYNEALDDFQRALDNGADSATVHYNMALAHLARKDRRAALNTLRRVFENDRQHKEARELYDRLIRKR